MSTNVTEKIISAVSEEPADTSSRDNYVAEKNDELRYVAHIVLFFFLGINALCLAKEYWNMKKALALTALFCFLFAVFDESYQEILKEGRAFEFADLLKDWAGAAIGMGITYIIKHFKKSPVK